MMQECGSALVAYLKDRNDTINLLFRRPQDIENGMILDNAYRLEENFGGKK